MKKELIPFAVMALAMASCSSDDVVDVNPDPSGDALSFSIAVGHSRATETTPLNLGDFAVVARGMHPDGVLYDNFLIGSGSAGEVATREGTSSIWNLGRKVYWPSTFEQVMFFAYTTLKSGDTGDALYSGSFGFENKNPYISGYKPKKAELTVKSDDATTVWADGKEQKDLLVAYTQQARSTSPTTVNLTFKHVLTQISITAGQMGKLDTDHRVVKIKGAWIVNAAESGKLSGDLHYNSTDKTSDDELSWTGTGKTAYGSFYNQILTLEKNGTMDLLRPEVAKEAGTSTPLGSLMLVPEDLTAWNKTQDDKGAYILLLCRVELKHSGANHDGSANMNDIMVDGDNHYHQLFPVNATAYNAAEYGFVCVPLSTTWNTDGIGWHYTYNLDICGATTGAGYYPPDFDEDFIGKLIPAGSKVGNEDLSVKGRPDDKDVGALVLDEPIKFSVDVANWNVPQNTWTPGNIAF